MSYIINTEMIGDLFHNHPVLFIVSLILQILVVGIGLYYFVVSWFCWYTKKEKLPEPLKTHTYALLVAAHNEEAVIANSVKSLLALDYPREAYDVFVIADNCTDRTAEVAREAGAIVCERTNDKERGKGFALEWMFKNLWDMDKQYDSIAVFDADNVIDKNFLKAINEKQNAGHKVVQGYIDSKNPFDSWITSSYTISFWTTNKLYQQSRSNLGLSCQLCGTGFVIDSELLKEIGWQATCLTEDIEFTMRLVMENQRVGYTRKAIVYDEKPLTLSQSWKQRIRWMQGQTDVAFRFVGKLFKKAFKTHSWAPVDCVFYLLQPLRIICSGAITFMAWVQTFYSVTVDPTEQIPFLQMWNIIHIPHLWDAIVILTFLYTPLIIWLEKRKFNWTLIKAYITYFFYSLTWIPIAIIGVCKKNNHEWFHTQHTRTLTIDEMNDAGVPIEKK